MIKNFSRCSAYIFTLTFIVSTILYYFFGTYFKITLVIHVLIAIISAMTYFAGYKGRGLEENVENPRNGSYNYMFRIGFSLLLTLSFFIIFGLVRTNGNFQYDSTENKAFTLSDQTKTLLGKISSNVKARYFIRGSNLLKNDIDLLNRYHQQQSGFVYTQHDLDKERPLADSLDIKEINSLHLSLVKDEKTSVIVSGTLTEEKITNALAKLARISKPEVYFTNDHGEGEIENSQEDGFSFLKEALLSDGFIVHQLNLTSVKEIPTLNSVIVMLCPVRNLIESEMQQIDEFLDRGGSLVVFTEPRIKTNLHELLERRGFVVGLDTIVGMEKFTSGKSTLGVQPVISSYASHASISNFDKSIIISAAVSVRKKASADDVTEVAFSGVETWAETDLSSLYSKEPKAIKDVNDLPGPIPFVSVKEKSGVTKGSRIVVVGDLDFAANVNIYQLFNRDFILNLINWTSGEDDFLTIRTETLRKSKKMITEKEFSNIFLWMAVILPEFVLMLGILSIVSRKAKMKCL